jgi:hypothetical protein
MHNGRSRPGVCVITRPSACTLVERVPATDNSSVCWPYQVGWVVIISWQWSPWCEGCRQSICAISWDATNIISSAYT